jgi:hypothetical protein
MMTLRCACLSPVGKPCPLLGATRDHKLAITHSYSPVLTPVSNPCLYVLDPKP